MPSLHFDYDDNAETRTEVAHAFEVYSIIDNREMPMSDYHGRVTTRQLKAILDTLQREGIIHSLNPGVFVTARGGNT